MSYFRSYFEKNNTILKNSNINTAKNPTTEIIYGSTLSKYIFKIDLTNLKKNITDGNFVLNNNTKHTLNLTNTIFGDERFLGVTNARLNQRATSFDLILFELNQEWDEGVGFDYQKELTLHPYNNNTYKEIASNWFNRTTIDKWTTEGIYTNNPTILKKIHFDNGNENLNVDITNYINSILNESKINYGLGIAFDIPFQEINHSDALSVAFFSMYTQTYFEPFVESFFDDLIIDNRLNITDKNQHALYLYVSKFNNNIDLDELPIVDVLDKNNNIISGLNNITAEKVKKGIYRIYIDIDSELLDDKKFFFDVWKNIKINGYTLPNVTQKFVPKPFSNILHIGSDSIRTFDVKLNVNGIKYGESININEKRTIEVIPKTYLNSEFFLHECFFKIYILEGKRQIIVHDWTQMNFNKNNYYLLDTSYLIPREYYIDFKIIINNEEFIYPNKIKFEIASTR